VCFACPLPPPPLRRLLCLHHHRRRRRRLIIIIINIRLHPPWLDLSLVRIAIMRVVAIAAVERRTCQRHRDRYHRLRVVVVLLQI